MILLVNVLASKTQAYGMLLNSGDVINFVFSAPAMFFIQTAPNFQRLFIIKRANLEGGQQLVGREGGLPIRK